VDNNPEAMAVMARRLGFARPRWHGVDPPVVEEGCRGSPKNSRGGVERATDLFAGARELA
jgi:hypothetical protein